MKNKFTGLLSILEAVLIVVIPFLYYYWMCTHTFKMTDFEAIVFLVVGGVFFICIVAFLSKKIKEKK